ncbi:MAG: coproporphyrinogen dehydrogenase HemZ [Clostridiales bacterium]|nr:coproporphyrinogen dehydrogenase HemZ [Bacillota bacterium]NLK90487.1 coproporphyrinogen dehydrogenase HemZ [Clostridiales bacterium]
MFFVPNTTEVVFISSKGHNNCDNKIISGEILLITELRVENGRAIAISGIDEERQITEVELNSSDKNEIKRLTKRIVKKSLFKLLKRLTDTKVPWGILTGIRPAKIVHDLLERNFSEEEILSILINEYYIDNDKAMLLLNIAKTGHRFIYPIDETKVSLYIGIPFCPTRCLYCSFPSNSLKQSAHLIDSYIDALCREIRSMAKLIRETGKKIQTIYIGGGTPTTLSVSQLARIFDTIKYTIDLNHLEEFTVEAGRPDTINYKNLMFLKKENVTRLSINPQTMSNLTLKVIGRGHTAEELIESYRMAAGIGFKNINMDIIIGLPGEDGGAVKYTMEQLQKLSPANLTVHTLAIKRASRLREMKGNYSLPNQQEITAMLKITQNYAESMGLRPYYMYRQKHMVGNLENIGYTKPGYECIYNIQIMEEKQTIIALGVGAVSKFTFPNENRLERVPNVKNLEDYIERIDEMIDRKAKFMSNLTSRPLIS